MGNHYFVTDDQSLPRYTVWRGEKYRGMAVVGCCVTKLGVRHLIRKDRRVQAQARAAAMEIQGKPVIMRLPVDPRDLPDLRTVAEFAPQA